MPITNINFKIFGHYLNQIFKNSDTNILFCTENEAKAAEITRQLKFFGYGNKILHLQAWDTAPFDKNSPSAEILTNRVKILCELLNEQQNKIIITSAANLIQKLPPKDLLKKIAIKFYKGQKINIEQVKEFFIENGYYRVSSVTDAGEFAVRGSIVDFVENNHENYGYRIDFEFDEIASIKIFNLETQLSQEQINEIVIYPASEILFNEEYITNFKNNFIKEFGVNHIHSPVYKNILESIKFPGYENLLPLFYNELDSFFEYLPKNIKLITSELFEDSLVNFSNSVTDYWQIRNISNQQKNELENFYYLVNKEKFYLSKEQVEAAINKFDQLSLDALIENNNDYQAVPNFYNLHLQNKSSIIAELKEFLTQKPFKTLLALNSKTNLERMKNFCKNENLSFKIIHSWDEFQANNIKQLYLIIKNIDASFSYKHQFNLINNALLFGEKIQRLQADSKRRTKKIIEQAVNLETGELVVHDEYGIGKYIGLKKVEVAGISHECLEIKYAKTDRLLLPVENIDLIKRYGGEEGELDNLGTAAWQSRRSKIKKRIKLAAEKLIKIAAERYNAKIDAISPDSGLYNEFCNKFAYAETDDQLKAIEDIKQDLFDAKPMDRLICGDAGFGKTEVAMRASFMVVANNIASNEKRQVAVIAPTTILCKQHYQNFLQRFAGFDVNIKQVSRLVKPSEVSKIKQQLAAGDIDIVVGTHALLASKIEFKNLQMLIVDEEQKFGVAQKEKIKALKSDLHVLTLSATPIPRTLQMSLLGIKELSLIATPPINRLPVKNTIIAYDEVIIREGLMREHFRGGRSFFVAPKISDLEIITKKLEQIVPELKYQIAHGQMAPAEIDEIMNQFYDGEFDILVSTTIVESGIDIPASNTIFIYKADQLGLSQLYQLRGRVGRGKVRGYAYLVTSPKKILSKDAVQRLEVMQNLEAVGGGFSIATQDMDIRGFGNLVGDEQSGQVKEVGIELYHEMLKEAIEKLKAENDNIQIADKPKAISFTPQINLNLAILIPENYISDNKLRLSFYRRAANLVSEEDIAEFITELKDRFGPIPDEFKNLINIVKIKALCKELMIKKIDAGPKGLVLEFIESEQLDYNFIIEYSQQNPRHSKMKPGNKLVILKTTNINDLKFTFAILNKLSELKSK